LPWNARLAGRQDARGGQWPTPSGDGGSTRYSPLDQITRDNVRTLEVAWTWKSDSFNVPAEFRNEATPIMANGVLFFPSGTRRAVVAVDAGTGETLWLWKMDEGARWEKAQRRVSRGVSYWTDGREERIYTVTPGMRLVALNARTGRPVESFGQAGIVDLRTRADKQVVPSEGRKPLRLRRHRRGRARGGRPRY
jgi:quinoprotein glucose dehydrogenase